MMQSNMEVCNQCLRLENRLPAASEHYVRLIVQHDQMIRDAEQGPSYLTARSSTHEAGGMLRRGFLWPTAEHTRIHLAPRQERQGSFSQLRPSVSLTIFRKQLARVGVIPQSNYHFSNRQHQFLQYLQRHFAEWLQQDEE